MSVSRSSKFFAAIRQSLRGDYHDYTAGSIPKAVFLLAVPMILELSLESVFALVDMFFVGRLGENAIATVGLTESVITILYSVAIGLSTAAGAVVARRIGEKNNEGASHAGAQSILIGFSVSLLLGLTGMIFAGKILSLMGASPDVVREGAVFTRIMFGGSFVIILIFLINGIFRGAGNAAMAMKSLWIASLTNIILCPLFIYLFGLKGAAIATVTGRGVGVLYQCWHLRFSKGNLAISKKHFTVDFPLIRSILNIAWPAIFQFIIASGSWIVMARLVAQTGGTAATAGYQIAIRNVVFFLLPAWGLSNAAATLVGQNLGANQIQRAEQSVMITAKFNAVFMAFVTVLFVFFSSPIVHFFTKNEAVAAYGSKALMIIGMGYIFYGIGMVMTQALNGAGDSRTPTVINFICFWLFQIPFAYLLTKGFNLGVTGVFIAFPVAETMIALVAFYFFKKGKWKEIKV